MTWGQAIEVVRAVNMKMHLDGFKVRSCEVQLGDGGLAVGYVKVAPRRVAGSP